MRGVRMADKNVCPTGQEESVSESVTVAVGKSAPRFKLAASTGKTISLEDYKGKQVVVLYFYPRADTPGCTTEACGFRNAWTDYERAKVAVLGVSPDPIDDVVKFANKHRLTFPLLAEARVRAVKQASSPPAVQARTRKLFTRQSWPVDRSLMRVVSP